MRSADYAAILRRHAVLLVVAALVGLLLGGAYYRAQTPVYESDSRVLVAARSSAQITDVSAGAALAGVIVKTYGSVATSPFVLNAVIRRLGLDETPVTLAQRVTAEVEPDSLVLHITVQDGDPEAAARISNAITTQLTASSSAITPTMSGSDPIHLTVIQGAKPAARPISPILPLDLAVGLLVALALAAGVVILRAATDTTVRSVEALRTATGLPVLGELRRRSGRRAAALARPTGGAVPEAIRTLRANLDSVDFDGGPRTVVITSALPGEGKTVVAANLAIALAAAGESVLLVDADLRRPAVANVFGLDGGVGLTDLLTGRLPVEQTVQPWGEHGLHVLPAGRVPSNPSELLHGPAMTELIQEAGAMYAWVLFDTAPLGPVSDAVVLAPRVAGSLLVSAVGRVRRPQLVAALEQLQRASGNLIGLVATRVPGRQARYAAYRPAAGDRRPRGAKTARQDGSRPRTGVLQRRERPAVPMRLRVPGLSGDDTSTTRS